MKRFLSDHQEEMLTYDVELRSAKRRKLVRGLAASAGAAALLLSGSAIWWWATTRQDDDASIYFQAHVVTDSQGSMCSKIISTACLTQSGEVHIPSGTADRTLSAYFELRPLLPGASRIAFWMFDPINNDLTPIQTREVRGRLSADEVLATMIEGTELTWEETGVDEKRGLSVLHRPPVQKQ